MRLENKSKTNSTVLNKLSQLEKLFKRTDGEFLCTLYPDPFFIIDLLRNFQSSFLDQLILSSHDVLSSLLKSKLGLFSNILIIWSPGEFEMLLLRHFGINCYELIGYFQMIGADLIGSSNLIILSIFIK